MLLMFVCTLSVIAFCFNSLLSRFITVSVFSVWSSQGFSEMSTGCVGVLEGITVGWICAGCLREPDFERCGFGVGSTVCGVFSKSLGLSEGDCCSGLSSENPEGSDWSRWSSVDGSVSAGVLGKCRPGDLRSLLHHVQFGGTTSRDRF